MITFRIHHLQGRIFGKNWRFDGSLQVIVIHSHWLFIHVNILWKLLKSWDFPWNFKRNSGKLLIPPICCVHLVVLCSLLKWNNGHGIWRCEVKLVLVASSPSASDTYSFLLKVQRGVQYQEWKWHNVLKIAIHQIRWGICCVPSVTTITAWNIQYDLSTKPNKRLH